MWRTTGDVKWREKGYAIFQAINKFARTEYGFASVHGVDGNIRQLDDMPRYGFESLIFSVDLRLITPCQLVPRGDS